LAAPVVIEHLNKRFESTRAVADVSLSIEPGELFFLLGPSGCGKTTLLRCIAGFCDPDSGTIRIGDQDVTNLSPHRRDTGMVFQSYALWPHLTVGGNVAFGLEMRRLSPREIRTRVNDALRLVRMEEKENAKPNELSGGQQQRVALARALVIQPRCLLLDEPLSNLDAKLRLEMRGEIRRICKDAGLTAIYVTHDQKEALSIADRIAVFRDGTVQQTGTPREVYRRPRSAFVAGFVGETNFIRGTVTQRNGEHATVETKIGIVVGHVADGTAVTAGNRVTASIRPEAINFSAPPADADNTYCGTLRHTVYLGEIAQHHLSLDTANGDSRTGSPVLTACELNPPMTRRRSEDETPIWIAPNDVVIFAE